MTEWNDGRTNDGWGVLTFATVGLVLQRARWAYLRATLSPEAWVRFVERDNRTALIWRAVFTVASAYIADALFVAEEIGTGLVVLAVAVGLALYSAAAVRTINRCRVIRRVQGWQ
jgi:hypothetical protein